MLNYRWLLLLALVTFAPLRHAFAQAPLPPTAPTLPYWVFFADKGDLSRYRPHDILSARALERRAAQGIEIDELDYPVDPSYVAQVTAQNVQVRLVSRWFNAAAVRVTPAQAQQLAALPCVQAVRQMGTYRVRFAAENTTPESAAATARKFGPGFFPQLDMLNLAPLHNGGARGNGVVLAVCDDGFNNVDTMEAFAYLRNRNGILGWYDYVDRDSTVFRQGGHGTNVLSTICGMLVDTAASPKGNKGYIHGTAPDVNVWLFRTEDAGSETPVEEANWVAAAERADSLGADIMHTSLGYTKFDDPHPDHQTSDMDGNTALITRGADIAASRGMLIINSAGNEGDDDWYFIGAPADGDSVLAIGAVDANGQIASFSSRGPSADGRIKPDVCGQGRNTIVVGVNGYAGPSNGTSFSGPIISGMACSILSANPGKGGMALFRAIVQSASQAQGPDNVFGFGVPDAQAASGYLALNSQAGGGIALEEHANGTGYFTVFIPISQYENKWMRIAVNGTEEWFRVKQMHTSFGNTYAITRRWGSTGGRTLRILDGSGAVVYQYNGH
jgi:hypothetical protein